MKGKTELLTNFKVNAIYFYSNGGNVVERISKSMQFIFLENCEN
jgi:hypothetical protein